MTKRELVLALSPQNVKAYLSRDDRHEPIHRRPEVAALFSKEISPTMIAYGDAPHAFEMSYPILSMYGQVMMQFGGAGNTEGAQNSHFLMPSCLSIHRHLGPTVATLRRTKDGVEFVSRGTIPLPSATVFAGLAYWRNSMDTPTTVESTTVEAPKPLPAKKAEASPKPAVSDKIMEKKN